jgi:hypothetical protein
VRVPIALLENYDQPLPLPSPLMVERIKQVARDLDSDDWRVRDRAQSQILAVGPPAMSVLKQIQPTAPAETSQRIDLIISRLSSELEKRSGPTPASGGGGDVDGVDPSGKLIER